MVSSVSSCGSCTTAAILAATLPNASDVGFSLTTSNTVSRAAVMLVRAAAASWTLSEDDPPRWFELSVAVSEDMS